MIRIIEYQGECYELKKRLRDDYIRIEWSDGFIDMKRYYYDKLNKKQRDLIFQRERQS